MTDKEIAKHVTLNQSLVESRELIDLSVTSLDQALARSEAAPQNPKTVFTTAQFLRDAHDRRALIYFRKLLDLPAPSPIARRTYLDGYLTACLEFDGISDNSEADQFSRELLESNPNDLSIQGTRGSVLIDLGRVSEGKAMLRALLTETEHPIIHAYANLFLALGEKRAGNLERAREHAKRATESGVIGAGVTRVADLLKPAGERRS